MDKFFRVLPIFLVLSIVVAWFFPLAALGTRFGWWEFRTAFALLGGAAMTGAVLLAVSGVGVLLAIARKNDKAKHRAALTALVTLVPLSFVIYFGVKAGQVPAIHDISTDQQNPPAFDALLSQRPESANPLDYTAEIAALQAKAYPEVQPLLLDAPLADVVSRARAVAKSLDWEVVNVDPQKGLVEATDTSFWFGFVDDVVVRVTAVDGKSRVDVRSVSRVGRGDIGKNAQRIETFLQQMEEGAG